ncbi:hypothetical protein [Amycolatopsis camponoti]|nr:hypothetical protein [Amycolatopsis camponoti]
MTRAADDTGGTNKQGEEGAPAPGSQPAPSSSDAPWQSRSGWGPALPLTLVYGVGAASFDVAEAIVGQCPHWVSANELAVDDFTPAAIAAVNILILVLSSDTDVRQRPRFREFRRIAAQFRDQHALRADAAFYGDSACWPRAGVLLVAYTSEAIQDPDARELIDDACASYCFTPGTPFTADIFEIFQPGAAQARRVKDPKDAYSIANWNFLASWGIQDLDFARTIKKAIEDRCRRLNDPNKPVMSRPLPDVALNRLELVLHKAELRPTPDPARTPAEQKKDLDNFVASGARAVREHLNELEKAYDGTETPFRRPSALRGGKRDAQAAYRKLYNVLRVVTIDS